MHTRVKVKDLNLRQWDHLTTEVPVNGREFLDGLPRLCVEFELTPDFHSLHIEMDVAEFATVMTRLEGIKNEAAVAALAEAALSETPGTGADGTIPCPDGDAGCEVMHRPGQG